MKRILGGMVVAVALSGSSFAADLGARTYAKAPAMMAPAANWSGWYAGVNAGWVGGANEVSTSGAVSPANTADLPNAAAMAAGATSSSRGSNSFIGGGQFGYNYQFSPLFVAGFEADIQGISRSRRSSSSSVFPGGPGVPPGTGFATNIANTSDPAYLGTFRARLGVTVNPNILLYATGGLAYGETKSDTAIAQSGINATNPNQPPFTITPASGAFSGMRVGYAVGAGGEWMFAPNWSAKLEYLYYDLGSATYSTGSLVSSSFGPTAFSGFGIGAVDTSTKVRFDDHIVRVGVNYHFN
ncbi:outer membrane immunogenic protein [Bradyrhizobium sp. AZCC 1678]|uniref:outer membrane protein n=1 Tax=Bradyrhizobium sp. AZCC 1678 TaxID=3117030 RepID=UPI002FEF7729